MLFRVARESASISLVEKAFDCICGLTRDWKEIGKKKKTPVIL